MTIQTEGGLRPSRIEMVEEPTQGVTPNNPDWRTISDRISTFETEGMGPEPVEKAGLGDTVHNIEAGLEEPTLTLEYALQRWFVDENNEANDLSAYGIIRVAGSTPSALSIVERMQSGDASENVLIQPASTVAYNYGDNKQASSKASRVYTVAKGCEVSEPTLTAEPSEVDWAVESSIMCDHARSFQIDQPNSSSNLAVKSTESGDTGIEITIESEGASTSESITLDSSDATTVVTTSSSFGDIDAIEVTGGGNGEDSVTNHEGNIEIALTDGSGGQGEILSVLYGSAYYGNTYGDQGVPTLGSGSHGGEIGTPFYKAANLGMYRPPGELFEAGGSVQTVELAVENDNERTPIQRSREQRIHIGMQTIEMTVTYDSETGSHRNLVERMAMDADDSVLEFTRNGAETVTLADSVVTETSRTREATENNTEQEVTLRAQPPGILFSLPQEAQSGNQPVQPSASVNMEGDISTN